MLGMETHRENKWRVQQELWHLINDEDVKQVLEAMIDKMKEVGDSSERIKQWRQEAKAYIPDDPKYDKKYWIAAYILYFHNSEFVNLINQIDDIETRMFILTNDLNKLEKMKQETRNKIQGYTTRLNHFKSK